MKILNETKRIEYNNNINIEIDYSESNSLIGDDETEEDGDLSTAKTVNLTNSDFLSITERLKQYPPTLTKQTSVNNNNSVTTNRMNVNNSSSETPTPSLHQAKLDLLKHLKLYLELCKIYERKTKMSNDSLTSPTSSTTSTSILSTYSYESKDNIINNTSLNNNNNSKMKSNIKTFLNNKKSSLDRLDNKQDFEIIDDDDDEDYLDDENEDDDEDEYNTEFDQNKIMTNKSILNKLKPLIPFNVYSDNEKFIGRDWLFKEIDKVSRFFC